MLFKVLNTPVKENDEIDNRYTYSCDSYSLIRISQIKWNLVITILIFSLAAFISQYKSKVKDDQG